MKKFDANGNLIENTELDGEEETPVVEDKVSKKELEKALAQLHKFKQEAKKNADELERLRQEEETRRKAELEEKAEWEKLAKLERQEKERIIQEAKAKKASFDNQRKKMAVIERVGGFKKPEFANFINLTSIQIDPESDEIIESTLEAEVTRIKQEYGDLLKTSTKPVNPHQAPQGGSNDIDLSKLSVKEQNDLITQMVKAGKF